MEKKKTLQPASLLHGDSADHADPLHGDAHLGHAFAHLGHAPLGLAQDIELLFGEGNALDVVRVLAHRPIAHVLRGGSR